MDFRERIIGIFTRPEATIEDILREPRVEEPFIIVSVYCILVAICGYLITRPPIVISIMSTILLLIFIVILWTAGAGLAYKLAIFLGGRGKYYPQMLTAIGYSCIILPIPLIINVILGEVLVPRVDVSLHPEIVQGTVYQMVHNPTLSLPIVIGWLGWIWWCYLSAIAVRKGEKVSRAYSYIAVIIPVVIYNIACMLLFYAVDLLWV